MSKVKKPLPPYQSQEGFVTAPILRGLHELKSIYQDVSSRGGIFCGGYVRWMCSPGPLRKIERPTDIDIFPIIPEVFPKLVEYFEKHHKLVKRFENNMSITYAVPKYPHVLSHLPFIQLVKPVLEGAVVATGTIKKVLSNFDFTVVRIGFGAFNLLTDEVMERWKYETSATPPTGPNLVNRVRDMGTTISRYEESFAIADADFIHDELTKTIRIKNIHCPISSSFRMMKYRDKGYWPPIMQVTKLFLDWDARSPEYRARILVFAKSSEANTLSPTDIDELERLLRID